MSEVCLGLCDDFVRALGLSYDVLNLLFLVEVLLLHLSLNYLLFKVVEVPWLLICALYLEILLDVKAFLCLPCAFVHLLLLAMFF
jgi:hypothetical protein